MFQKLTVFVIGAGAHFTYGFPLGTGLRKQILEMNVNSIRGDASEFPTSEMTEFQNEFRNSNQTSIDVFLKHRREFDAIGKRCITRAIHAKESFFSDAVENDIRPGDWIGWLLNGPLQCDSPAEFVQNRVAFVTFNYDRLLEHILFTSLRSKFGIDDEQTAVTVEKIPIIHVHGAIGRLPWQTLRESEYVLPFDRQSMGDDGTYKDRLKKASTNLRLFHENTPSSHQQDLDKARELLRSASLVKFLGFAYQSDNLAKLELKTGFDDDRVLTGTTVGLSAVERMKLQQVTMRGAYKSPGRPEFDTTDKDCLQHLRECEYLSLMQSR